MANTIKHKRGSGSNPSASDLVAGEIAIRTDTGVLFTKKDDNTVASISGGLTDLGVSTTSSAVTVTSSTGNNATISEASSSAAGVMSTAHHDKLDGIESGATADQTASEILTAIKTVDGSGTGLDADLLDGVQGSSYLRSDADDIVSGHTKWQDTYEVRLGNSSDMKLHHTSGANYIDVAQQLLIRHGTETMIRCNDDADVQLYYDNSKKLNTTSSGIDVSGVVDIDSHVRHNGDTNTYFGFDGTDQINFYTSGSQRLKIDHNGMIYFNQYSTHTPGLSNTTVGGSFEALSSGGAFFSSRSDGPAYFANRNNDGNTMEFRRSGSTKGSISVNSSNTSFNTSSDYRLKENVVDLTGAITRVKQLQPKRFNFISDPGVTQDGFLAHEAATVVPWAVNGTHNQVELWGDYETDELPDGVSVGDPKLDDDGNTIPVMQGMDYGKVTPLLTAALQEAIAKIETLETQNADLLARVTALEGS